jgi:hypothetical protein
MQTILEQDRTSELLGSRTSKSFGDKIGLLGALFGCWHKSLSRPFTIGNDSYCSCLDCGARKHFDPQTLRTFGSFHYPPAVSLSKN